MKKQVLSTFLLLLMPFYNCIAQSDLYSGTCGNGLTWTYSETTKTLTISGAGDMYNYDRITKLAPWYNFRNDIQKVILGSEVYSIGDYAFINMPITSIVIPNSVARIGKWAFFSSDLISVEIPNGIVTLEESTFNGCDKLTQINLPNTLTTIGYKAFYRCRSLASIEIPDKVTSIGELAFWECHSLTSVTIPKSVTSIGANAFDGEAEYTPNIQTIISFIVNPFEIAGRTSYDERSHYVGVFSRKTLSNAILYVPKGTVDKYKSTNGWKDFNNIVEISGSDNPFNTEVEINNIKYRTTSSTEVEVIHKDDYSGDIIIPETVSINDKEYRVTSIGKRAFNIKQNSLGGGCKITSLQIPNSVTSIGSEAFSHCDLLKTVKLPDDIAYLDTATFAGCSSLESITLPRKLQEIKASAFANFCGLKSIEIPDQVYCIGGFAFQNNRSLKTVITSNGLKEIYYFAFSYCDSLQTIVLGKNVEKIGCNAFDGCNQLSRVYSLNSNPPRLNQTFDYGGSQWDYDIFVRFINHTFIGINEDAILYVPAGSKVLYQNNAHWSLFKNIKEFDPNNFNPSTLGIRSLSNDKKEVNRYSLDGRKLLSPSKGINIIKMRDGTVKKVLIK